MIYFVKRVRRENKLKPHFQEKKFISTSRPLELLDIDLFGSTRTTSISGKRYGLVIVGSSDLGIIKKGD